MNKRTRLIILLACVVSFFVATPVIIGYSLGYRLDLEKIKIVATGGIYVRTFPSADQITIDSNISQKPGIFANSIFVQSLLPKNHTVSIKKAGYYDYSKILLVQENTVTKLENVLLFKKNPTFSEISNEAQSPFIARAQQEKFAIRNNNLYYSDVPQNSSISASAKKIPLIKGLDSFVVSGNNTMWLGTDGFLYQAASADLPLPAGKNPEKLSLKALKLTKTGIYKIISSGQYIFLNNNGELLLLDGKTHSFNIFAESVKDVIFSPDLKNLVYSSNNNLYISLLSDPAYKKTLLYKSQDNITDYDWINNDYVIFTAGNKVLISEIDYRGNVNTIILPQTVKLNDGTMIDVKTPQILFNKSDSQLYILTGKTLLVSEKLTQ